MQDDLEDAVENALVHSHAALQLMERWLYFVAGRDPALVQAFAELVVSSKPSGAPAPSPEIQELEEAALELQQHLATQVLAFLHQKGGRPHN